MRLALAQGADAVECDVQLTADGAAVVLHDADLARVGGSNIPIAERESAAVVGHSVVLESRTGEPSQVLSLAQWRELLPDGVLAVVELKEQASAKLDYRLIDSCNAVLSAALEPPAVISFSLPVVAEVKLRHPDWCVGPIANRPLDPARGDALMSHAHGCVVLKKTVLDRDWIRRFDKAGHEVWSYALDEPEEIERALDLGVTGVISNRPDVARQCLASWSGPDA